MGTPGNNCVQLSASATGAVAGDGRLHGIFVATSTSLTLKIYDNVNGQSGTVLMPTTAAITAPTWITFPASFSSGLSVTIGGSGTFTLVYTRAV